MASELIVPVTRVKNLREHPNAALLCLADVLGYQMVLPLEEKEGGPVVRKFVKGSRDEKGKRVPFDNQVGAEAEDVHFTFKYTENDLVVYFPADTLLPAEWADKFGVKAFLRGKNQDRVGRIALRGEPSFGLVVSLPEGVQWQEGDNVADYYGCEKFIPPIRATAGDAAAYDANLDPFVLKYTDIQNGRLFVDLFADGEDVVVTEKIHGTNCRLGGVRDVGMFAGSMEIRRKRPTNKETGVSLSFDDPEMKRNVYWFPWSIPGVADLINSFCKPNDTKVVILYGEVYGSSVQSLAYGLNNKLGFLAFDLSIDGKYLDWDEFETLCEQYGVPTVPVLYRGPFGLAKMKELADGNSTLTGANHIREGVVVKPVRERTHPKVGRLALKYIGLQYDLSKHKEKDTKDV
jgi:RNA ligase (TIGR02306 family)